MRIVAELSRAYGGKGSDWQESPAPTNKTKASAISPATSVPCDLAVIRVRIPATRAGCADRRAGSTPNSSAAATPRIKAHSSTRMSTLSSSAQRQKWSVSGLEQSLQPTVGDCHRRKTGDTRNSECLRQHKVDYVAASGPQAPTGYRFHAPARAVERASRRLATFTHAITSTRDTAPSSRSSRGRCGPVTCSNTGIPESLRVLQSGFSRDI